MHQYEESACVVNMSGGVSSNDQRSARNANPINMTPYPEPRRYRHPGVKKSHRLFLAHYGFKVRKGWVIHHINGIHNDDRPENWELKTNSRHSRDHSGNRLGHKHTEQAKAKMSVAKMGHECTEGTRRKMSASKIGNSNALGHKRSEETKGQIAATVRAWWVAKKEKHAHAT